MIRKIRAIGYLMLDKLIDIAGIRVDAIKDLNIDKVVVYDYGSEKVWVILSKD